MPDISPSVAPEREPVSVSVAQEQDRHDGGKCNPAPLYAAVAALSNADIGTAITLVLQGIQRARRTGESEVWLQARLGTLLHEVEMRAAREVGL